MRQSPRCLTSETLSTVRIVYATRLAIPDSTPHFRFCALLPSYLERLNSRAGMKYIS